MTRWTARRLHDNAKNRERPNNSENRRATNAAKRTQRERRVCSGDQQENRGMIEHTQNGFCARLRPCVIKRRSEIEQQHCRCKNDCADKKSGAAALKRGQEQDRRPDQRGDEAHAVTDAIRQFFACGLRPPRQSAHLIHPVYQRRHRRRVEQFWEVK